MHFSERIPVIKGPTSVFRKSTVMSAWKYHGVFTTYDYWLYQKNGSVNVVVSTELFFDVLSCTVIVGCCLLQKFWLLIPISVKRTDSVQSKRKVSSLSDRSDTSEQGGGGEVSGEESPGILSDDQPPESPSDSNDTDDTSKNMPWLKVSVCDFHKYPNLYCLLYLHLSK